ncbi:hypothetical protein [Streptomyces sp. NPDC005251]|uniref:hypothetical protein n=1 Tax=unclassified Streptomyces TaxID=2593676 RepID=UPI0033B63B25
MSWQSGDPEARPKVYLPQSDGETPPAYETYTDPAEAHGWRKAYADGDDTTVLAAVPGDPAGRQERLLRRRRARLNRRMAVAGGAAGVVVLGIAVAGMFDSGAAGEPGGTPVRTAGPVHLATGPAQPADTTSARADVSAAPSGSAGAASPGATTTAGASTAPSASTAPAPSASTAATTSVAPAPTTPTASATAGTGGHGHGHGHGGSWPN